MWAFKYIASLTFVVAVRPANTYRAVEYRADLLRQALVPTSFGDANLSTVPQKALHHGPQTATSDVVIPESAKEPKKHPVHVFDWSQVSGTQAIGCSIALFFCGVLVSAAGIGGGGIFLAILMLVGGITPRDAVPLSHAIVMLGSLGSLGVSFKSWWTSGSMDIDLDTCRMVVPASLLGTLFGFLMNSMVPDSLILKLLAIVLSGLVVIVVRIWNMQRKEESTAPIAGAMDPSTGAVAEPGSSGGPGLASGVGTQVDLDEGKNPSAAVTRPELLVAFVLLVVVDVCSVLSFHMSACMAEKTRHHIWGSCQHPFLMTFLGRHMQFDQDSAMTDKVHFTVQWLPIILCMAFATFYANHMYVKQDWPVSRVATVQGMGWATGVIAGLAGIGGGLIYSPFFLLSMDPLVAVSTSTTCLFFIAASATFQYALTDRIMMSLATTYGAVVFCASILGTMLVRMVRHRLPRGKSHITFCVVTGVVLTNCLIVGKLVMQMRHHIVG